MGNKKNKKNKKYSTHRSKSVYIKKKLPTKSKPLTKKNSTNDNQQTKDKDQQTNSTEGIGQGSRIVNVDKLQQYTDDLTKHATRCDGSIALSSESRDGLASVFSGECSTWLHWRLRRK